MIIQSYLLQNVISRILYTYIANKVHHHSAMMRNLIIVKKSEILQCKFIIHMIHDLINHPENGDNVCL